MYSSKTGRSENPLNTGLALRQHMKRPHVNIAIDPAWKHQKTVKLLTDANEWFREQDISYNLLYPHKDGDYTKKMIVYFDKDEDATAFTIMFPELCCSKTTESVV